MKDREKILLWLEKCRGICNENTDCDVCPFDGHETDNGFCADLLEEAIRRELTPVEPATWAPDGAYYVLKFCGNCGAILVDACWSFCPICGRAIQRGE